MKKGEIERIVISISRRLLALDHKIDIVSNQINVVSGQVLAVLEKMNMIESEIVDDEPEVDLPGSPGGELVQSPVLQQPVVDSLEVDPYRVWVV